MVNHYSGMFKLRSAKDMNNIIFKSERKAILSTIAAVAVSIGFTACSEDNLAEQAPTMPSGGYQVCIPANMGGAVTRAIAYNSETGGYDATFETTDNIRVFDVDKVAMSTTDIHPEADGKSANLVGQLAFENEGQSITPNKDDNLMLLYNTDSDSFDYSRNFAKGDKEADYAVATTTIKSIADGKISTSAATFKNPQSIYKINFTDIAPEVKIKKVSIKSGQGKLVERYMPTQPEVRDFLGNVYYKYKDDGTDKHNLTFMLRFLNSIDNPENDITPGDELTFIALGSDALYYGGSKTVTTDLVNSKYYYSDVAMENLGQAMTLTNNTTEKVALVDTLKTQIKSKEAAYTIADNGFDNEFDWQGGDNALTLRNVNLENSNNAINVLADVDDFDNTKSHNLILDGDNILNCTDVNHAPDAIVVEENCSLNISTSDLGTLIINGGAFVLNDNSTVTIESGGLYINDNLVIFGNPTINVESDLSVNKIVREGNGGKCVLSKSGEVRFPENCDVPEGFIQAASGYTLELAAVDGLKIYSVTNAE